MKSQNNYDYLFKFIIVGDSSTSFSYCRCRQVMPTS